MANKRNGIANLVGILGAFLSIGCIIYGFVLSVQIIVEQWGVPMGGVSVLIFPATMAIMPWYSGFVLGNWWILGLVWGGSLVANISQELMKA